MAKQLKVTSEIEARIRAGAKDDTLDTSGLAVFETVLADTRPLNKRGSLFDKARLSRSMLSAMSDHVNGGNSVPLHTLHRYGGELPVGRVFYAQVLDTEDGESELRGQFYLPNTKTDLVSDINAAVLNSVSIGAKAEKILCSECGWDYLGEDASFMNLWDRTCANDHVVGENGTHTKLVGLDQWMETSLVSEGAVPQAKIVSRAAAKLTAGEIERLAANNIDPRAVVLTADFKETKVSGSKDGATFDPMALVTQLTNTSSELALVKVQLADKDKAIEAKDARIAELEAQVAATETPVAELTEKLTAAEQALASAQAKLAEQCKAALIASGKENPEVPETIEAMLAAIEEAGVKLHQAIPDGGKAQPATNVESDDEDAKARLTAFKTVR